jgi:hypothetical protein
LFFFTKKYFNFLFFSSLLLTIAIYRMKVTTLVFNASGNSGRLIVTGNEENSPTFDRRVSPLVGAATQESNVWVLSVKGRRK